jgi:hypothetical protein
MKTTIVKIVLAMIAVIGCAFASGFFYPKSADCAGNCPSFCVNSAQCGLLCACIVPRHGALGTCQYVRTP